MEIGKYIAQALINHSAVHVEGLGVFRKVHRPSTYDKVRQVYLPPLNYVEFDSLDQEGFSLSTFIQQADNIQKAEATDAVRKAVDNLYTKVEENSEVYLETLGHLIQYGNALIFKPQDLTGFALAPIPPVQDDNEPGPVVKGTPQEPGEETQEDLSHIPPVQEEEAAEDTSEAPPISEEGSTLQKEDSEVEKSTGIINTEESISEEAPIEEAVPGDLPIAGQALADVVDEPSEEFEESPKRSRGVWYLLAGLLALGIIGGLWYYNQVNQTETTNTPSQSEESVDQSATISATDSTDIEDGLTGLGDSTNLTPPEETPTQEAILPANHNWYIVIGAHRSYSQAEDEVERYKRQGHTYVRMLPKNPSDTYIRVIWDSYSTKEEADSALRYVQKNFVADAWHREIKR